MTPNLQYFWSYSFIRMMVYVIGVSAVGILLFLGVSAGIVARRTRKTGSRGAFTIQQLNDMSKQKGVL
jgi:hypothetical protein